MHVSDRAPPGQSLLSRACKIDAYPRSSTKMLTFGIGSNDYLAAKGVIGSSPQADCDRPQAAGRPDAT